MISTIIGFIEMIIGGAFVIAVTLGKYVVVFMLCAAVMLVQNFVPDSVKDNFADYFTEKYNLDDKMYEALENKNCQAFAEAVNEGSDPNEFDYNFFTTTHSPLVYAVNEVGSKSIIRTVLDYDIDPNLVDKSGMTVFYEVLESDEAYNRLLPKADLNFVSKKGENGFDYLIKTDSGALWETGVKSANFKSLTEAGAEATAENIERMTDRIKEYGVSLSYLYDLKVLIDNCGSAIDDENVYAAFKGTFSEKNKCDSDLVLYGLAAGCKSSVLSKYIDDDSNLNFLLQTAIVCGNLDCVKYLTEKGAELIYEADGTKKYNIRLAAQYNNTDVLDYIISVDPTAIDDCVYLAAENRNLDMIKFLMGKGAKIYNKNAFDKALQNGDNKIIKYFIDNGFNINDVGNNGLCKYMVDIYSRCDIDTIKTAEKYAEELNKNDIAAAIYECAHSGNYDGLVYLKESGISDFNVCDTTYNSETGEYSYFKSYTPLMTSVEHGFYEIIRFLVENGANTGGYTDGMKEQLILCAGKSDDIYEYLKSKGIIEAEENEEDLTVFEEALRDYEESNKKSRPITDFWKELDL
ncbi:MAG: ankyrin repeat domain-containing protein [Clostridiales bacterium]|nr:ankyrin repeat domain-containing protein [Clostridiales bacterium]